MAEEIKTSPAAAPEEEVIILPAHPPKKKPAEDVANAKLIANRYLNIQALEKIVNAKKARQEKKKIAARFKAPETPEEFYLKGQKYQVGAECAVPFSEKATYYQKAAEMFAGAGDYQDAEELAKVCAERAKTTLDQGYSSSYREAQALKAKAVSEGDWFKALRAFQRIPEYKNAEQLMKECQARLDRLHSAKRPMVILVVALIAALIVGGRFAYRTNPVKYYVAKAASGVGIDSAAASLLEELGTYRDSEELLSELHYQQGVKKMNKGSYASAIRSFNKCVGYADSDALAQECHFYYGQAKLEAGELEKARNQFLKAGDYADAEEQLLKAELTLIQETAIGETVSYGTDEYIVLDKQDSQVLLLAKKLYSEPYHQVRESVTWADCDMRKVLNGSDYLDEHFTAMEQEKILTTSTGSSQEKLFLLSAEEYQLYEPVMGSKKAIWWLRDNGDQPDTAMFVSYDGALMEAGYPVNSEAIQGRAAMWIDTQG
jgi:TolA-binding protein